MQGEIYNQLLYKFCYNDEIVFIFYHHDYYGPQIQPNWDVEVINSYH